MANTQKNILYIGSDKGYWSNLTHRFKLNYQHVEFDFINLPPCNMDTVNSQILECLDINPSFVYLDLSKTEQPLYQLGQYLKRTTAFANTPVIGLIEDINKLEETLLLGFDFVFIKCAEIHDVIYHPYFKRFPKEALKKDFALARTTIESKVVETMRIGYFAEDYMHIECDSDFNVGDILKIKTSLPEDCVKSKYFTVKHKSERDLYYSYRFSYDLEYKLIDDLVFNNEDIEEANKIADEKVRKNAIDHIQKGRNLKIEEHEKNKIKLKKNLKAWINDNKDAKVAKRTKVLIVDENLSFLTSEKRRLDSFPCTIRIETALSDDFIQIDHYLPQLIVFKIPEVVLSAQEEMLPEDKQHEIKVRNESKLTEFFSRLVSKVNSIEDYTPFIIIFNCKSFTSKAFQDTFRYDFILTNPNRIDLDMILKMADLYQTKQDEKFKKVVQDKIAKLRKEDPLKYGKLNISDFEENRFYVSKKHKLSRASYEQVIQIKAISESEVYFLTEYALELGNYRLSDPFPMVIRLVPQDGKPFQQQDGKLLYKSLIHSIGENEKKELRRHINDVYTSHKKEEREKEEAEFQELNKKVLEEALEKEKNDKHDQDKE
ncbi:hypothetical protein [Bacteriovorax sp. Seq25_V]|uniref:hypothetical protein n=1 Tax=Bacteriovorax sp. Seq25_V TaxID=1201288 RepID=UPI00038A2760|nr:hypothetical protein [Bacteriovorax sp. Seq25_V]EQC48035.1 hypothetical protein M900_1121 [Bacteriovorax sp. Seq25_V]